MEDENNVTAIAWIESDGVYDGCFIAHNGEPTEVGAILVDYYSDKRSAKRLIEKKQVHRLLKSIDECVVEEAVSLETPCGESVMKTQTKELANYCYVYSNGMWYLGDTLSSPLQEIMRFIQRH
jgi:hypothetical protein